MKRGFTVWQLVLLLFVLGLIAAVLFPLFAIDRGGGSRRSGCQSNLKKISLMFQQYVQDSDGRFPPARQISTNRGWMDSLQPYMRSTRVFQCPQAPATSGPSPRGLHTDYFYNARLARFPVAQLASSSYTVLNGDGDSSMVASSPHYAISSLPQEWLRDTGPRYRHLGGSFFAFADGHVKWYAANRPIGTGYPAAGLPTVAPR